MEAMLAHAAAAYALTRQTSAEKVAHEWLRPPAAASGSSNPSVTEADSVAVMANLLADASAAWQ